MKRILVTGGAGFIGFHLCSHLAEDPDTRLTIVENFSRGRKDADFDSLFARGNVDLVSADLTIAGSLENLKGSFDRVYHLAAMVGVKHCSNNPTEVLRVNLLSTLNIVDFAIARNCGRLFFSSTSETYSGGHALGILPIPTPENVPLVIPGTANPRLSYAVAKLAGEQYAYFAGKKHGLPVNIGRYHNVYGPRMGFAHVIPEVIKRVLAKEDPFHIFGGDQTRAFCHVDDAVRASVAVMESQVQGEIFHIGADRETRIYELIRLIMAHFGFSPKEVSVPAPHGSVDRRCPDISKLRRVTGFFPSIPLEKGLSDVCVWYENALKEEAAWE